MRADAKVYILRNENGQILSVNASLKNLMEKMIETRLYSRGMAKRSEVIKHLKANPEMNVAIKNNGYQHVISTANLGEMMNFGTQAIEETPEETPEEAPEEAPEVEEAN